MSTARTIAKNTTVLFIATIVSYVLALFTTMYTARYLGAEGFGIISLALALTGIFSVFTDLGLSTLTVREIARKKSLADKYIVNTSLIKVFLSILTFILMALTVYILNYPPQVAYVIYLITLSIVFTAFSGVFNAVFQAYEKMEYISVGNILNSVILFSGVLIAIYFNLDIFVFAALYFIASLIVLVYSTLIYSWKFSLPKMSIDLSFGKLAFKEALPFGITNIFGSVYYWIDSIMLSKMASNEVVGWYNAAYRLMFVFLAVYTVYVSAVFPAMSKFYNTAEDSLRFSFQRSYKYLLIISLPIAVGTTLLAHEIILLFYGTGYEPAVICLQILIWTVPLLFINGLSGYLLSAVNRQVILSKITFVAVILNVVLNLLLIPKFSLIGSSAATFITELALTIIIIYLILKTGYTDKKSLFKDIPKIILSNAVMAILIIYLKDINLLLIVLLASVTYFAAIYIFKALDKEDINLFKSIIKK